MPNDDLELLDLRRAPFADLLGLDVIEATPDRVVAELMVREELCTYPRVLHGGAVMSLADNLGAMGTVLNLPEGARTTTLESKTNFIAPIPEGEKAVAECTPLHRGRTTMVWQTRISREDGRLAAVLLMGPELDANYRAVCKDTFEWE